MAFQPATGLGGFAGWTVLQRSMSSQTRTFDTQPDLAREEAYFRQKIGQIKTADALVADRRLLKVALEAFGLGNDLDNRAFIQKVLAEGTLKTTSFANKLADKTYVKLAQTFGFGDYSVPRTQMSDFADKILAQWKTRRFETAVGEVNPDYRLALNAERELPELAASTSSEDTKWYRIIGNRALRTVFEKALALPADVWSLPIDQQVPLLKSRLAANTGKAALSQFTQPAAVQALIKRFLTRTEVDSQTAAATPAANALVLLQQGSFLRRY